MLALGFSPTVYATDRSGGVPAWEYWAEAVGIWVFQNEYPGLTVNLLEANAIKMIEWVTEVFRPTGKPTPDPMDALR